MFILKTIYEINFIRWEFNPIVSILDTGSWEIPIEFVQKECNGVLLESLKTL